MRRNAWFSMRVRTDYISLKWLHNLRNPTGKLARWSLELLTYDIEIIHHKGALHSDALSKVTEDDEIPISSSCDTRDSWYKRRVAVILERPWIFRDWKVEDSWTKTRKKILDLQSGVPGENRLRLQQACSSFRDLQQACSILRTSYS